MHSNHSVGHAATKAEKRGISRAIRLGLVAAVSLLGAGFGASACLDRPLCDVDCRPRTTNVFVDTITQKSVDKIDLLFMIDNSSSMADKQAVLQAAVPALVKRLVSPNCVDPTNGARGATTPADPATNCPAAEHTVREFNPIKDIHIGVITSSLGDHGGGSTCVGTEATGTQPVDLHSQEQNDHGHLIGSRPRFAPDLAAAGVPTQAAETAGYLDWSPGGKSGKPANQDVNAFNNTFKVMVTAVGEFGCGLEAQLESIYRFLADPTPPASIIQVACPAPSANQKCSSPTGLDQTILTQRAAFLRPDSLVAVIMVTDENDCSIRDERQYFYAATDPGSILLPHGSQACVTNPNDPCCYSCGSTRPAACPVDPTCSKTPPNSPTSTVAADQLNLRCFHEKQRFGLDFLYPTQRYVNALSKTQLCVSSADLNFDPANPGTCPGGAANIKANPLFSDLSGKNSLGRPPSYVFFAGIVGVPWQDLQATINPATMAPYADPDPTKALHYKTADQLESDKVWEAILGDPTASPPIIPTDGLMVESTNPRSGNDINGKLIPGPQAPATAYNQINIHEWADKAQDDLMYACVFPLLATRNCTTVEAGNKYAGCDCGSLNDPADNNPLCQNPADGTYGTTQYRAKGYPGIRELQTLHDFGKNSIVASICAKELGDTNLQDYGYQPAVDAIVDRLKEALTGRCLPRKLVPNAAGTIPCSVIEVRPIDQGNNCAAIPGRSDPGPAKQPALDRLKETGICDAGGTTPACSHYLLCAINALPATSACHKDQTDQPDTGWCYVDPSVTHADPKLDDDKSLVSKCPATAQQIVRFVGDKTPAQGAQVLIACFGAPINDSLANAAPATSTGAGGAATVTVSSGGATSAGSGGTTPASAGGATGTGLDGG